MTTADQIIQSAFREGALIEPGWEPTAAEQTEALERLNRMILSLYGTEMGEEMTDWLVPAPQRTTPIAANYPQLPYPADTAGDVWPLPFATDPTDAIFPYPPPNSRIIFGNVTNTCWFPETPRPGTRMAIVPGSGAGDSGASGQVLTLNGNGRTIEGASTQAYAAPITARQWFYREDLGDWQAVVDLALTSSSPWPSDWDDLLITGLYIRLCPRYRKTADKESLASYARMLKAFKARYRQEGVTVYGSQDFPRSLQSYISGRWWW